MLWIVIWKSSFYFPFYISALIDCDDNGNNCCEYGYGGSCDMNGGQKFSDFIFGATMTRGIFGGGGKCGFFK